MLPVPDDNSSPPRLPLELTLRILSASAHSSATRQARNVCLVSRAVYRECWPSLYRIAALRNARQLKGFSESIFPPQHKPCLAGLAIDGGGGRKLPQSSHERRLARMQDAVRFLYMNNNKDGDGLRSLATDEKPEMWMISILLAASNLEILHFEEYWSLTYPWEAQEEKPLIAYPLMLLSRFTTAFHAAFVGSPNAPWVKRMFGPQAKRQQRRHDQADDTEGGLGGGSDSDGYHDEASELGPSQTNEDAPSTDIYDAIMALQRAESLRRSPPRLLAQPAEVTLSALALSPSHLLVGSTNDVSSATHRLPNNEAAFARLRRLHLSFAKLTPFFCDALASMPALTHLRLTRPFSENLIDGVMTLLQHGMATKEEKSRGSGLAETAPPLEALIVEAGIYMDEGTIRELGSLEKSTIAQGRLFFIMPDLSYHTWTQTSPDCAPEPIELRDSGDDTSDRDTSISAYTSGSSSSANAVNYVTSSEQRGFGDFVARTHGHDGIWAPAKMGAG